MAIMTFGVIHKEESQTQGYSEVHLYSPVCGGRSLLGPRQSTGTDQTEACAGDLGSFPGPCWCEQNDRILKNLSCPRLCWLSQLSPV